MPTCIHVPPPPPFLYINYQINVHFVINKYYLHTTKLHIQICQAYLPGISASICDTWCLYQTVQVWCCCCCCCWFFFSFLLLVVSVSNSIDIGFVWTCVCVFSRPSLYFVVSERLLTIHNPYAVTNVIL